MCDEAMGKMENKLHLWIHEVMANFKSLVERIAIRLKAKEILGHVTQGEENVRRKRLLLIYHYKENAYD